MEPVSEIIQAKVEPEKERIATHDPALLELNEEQKEFRQLEDRLGEFLQAYSQNPISAKPNSSSFNDQMAYPLDYQQNTRPAAIPDRPGLEAQYGYREVHDGGYVYQPEQQTRDAEDPSAQAGNTSAERLMI